MKQNNCYVILAGPGFKEKLVIYRNHYGMTAKQLSEKLGVSESYLSYLEAGQRQPNRSMIHKLVQAFFPEGNPLVLDEWLSDNHFLTSHARHPSESYSRIVESKQAWYCHPQHLATNLDFIWALIAEKQTLWAKQQIQGCIQYFTEPVYDKWLLGLFELTHGHWDTAIVQMELALQVCPTVKQTSVEHPYPQLMRSLGKAYVQKALAGLFTAAAPSAPLDLTACLAQAMAYLTQAVSCCQAPLFRQEQLHVAYLSALYTRQVQWSEVVHDLRQCLVEWPQYDQAEPRVCALELAALLGSAYAWNGQITEAEESLNVLRICHPHYWRVYHALAGVFCLKYGATQERDWLEQALEALQKMVNYLPTWESLAMLLQCPAVAVLQEQHPKSIKALEAIGQADV